MRKNIIGVTLCAVFFALCVPAEPQPLKTPRIGFLSGSGTPSNPSTGEKAFRQGLRDLGYVDGKNIVIEFRYAEEKRDLIPSLVAELVQLKVDLIATGNLTAIRAAMEATKTIPIVMVTNADPVATKVIDSLGRPGGNVTGLTNLNRDLNAKRLELLKEITPNVSRVAILWDSTNEGSAIGFREYEAVAQPMRIRLQFVELRGPSPNLEAAFQGGASGDANALIPIRSAVILHQLARIADLVKKTRLPSISDGSNFVEAGGLVSYASNDADLFRRAAVYVDKILKGTKPADLPVEQPTKFELVINLKPQTDRPDDSAVGADASGQGHQVREERVRIGEWERGRVFLVLA
jgi:putative tryptophan/tyrosine transport system substrate-binding protein